MNKPQFLFSRGEEEYFEKRDHMKERKKGESFFSLHLRTKKLAR